MANETLRFDIIAQDRASSGFSAAGRSASEAAGNVDKLTRRLDEVSRKSVAARVGLKGNDEAAVALDRLDAKLLGLDRRVASPHLKVEGAARAIADISAVDAAIDKLGRDTDKAKKANDGWAASLQKAADSAKKGGGPAWLGPALLAAPAATSLGGVAAGAAIGLGGAAVAGAGALAAYGLVAKSVFSQAATAAGKVETAQNNYNVAIANGTKQATAYKAEQIAIGKAYAELSPQQIALSKQLGAMAGAWQDLKASFTPLVAGSLQPWLHGITTALQSLGSVIKPMAGVVHDLGVQFAALTTSSVFRDFAAWMGRIGAIVNKAVGNALLDFLTGMMFLLPQFTPLITGAAAGLTHWADAFVKWSASQKAADQIHAFLDWFHTNGPVVGALLKNIGEALKALAPGLTTGAMTELQVVSQFFAFVAKLPPGVAKPLAEVAGALLILNKLGVFSVGVKLTGVAAGKFAETAVGKALLSGAGSLILPVTLSVAAIAGLSQIKDKTGGGTLLAPKAADLGFNGRWAHDIAHWFDVARHEVSGIWDLMWNNTIGRARRGVDDVFHWVSSMRDKIGGFFSGAARWLVKSGSDIITGAWNGLKTGWGWVTGWASRIYGWVTGWFSRSWTWLVDAGKNVITGVWNGLKTGWGWVSGWASRIWGWVTGWFSRSWTWLVGAGGNIITGLWNGIKNVWNGVSGWFGHVWGWVTGVFHGAGIWLWNSGFNIIYGLFQGLKSLWNGVNGVFSWFAGLPKKILQALGIKSPPKWAIDAGGHIMGGILKGLAGGGSIESFFTNKVSSVFNLVKDAGTNIWHALFGGGGAAAGSAGGGVQRWRSTVLQALRLEGLPASLANAVLYQMQTESGGAQYAVNRWDSNAARGTPSKGLMQVIDPTFQAYHVAGTSWNIFDPLANIAAAIAYGAHGRGFGSGPGQIGSGHGYALGTMSAAPGWAWVGERGPELMHFRGGEQVVPAHAAKGGNTYNITVNVPPGANMAEAGRATVTAIRAYEQRSGKGWRS